MLQHHRSVFLKSSMEHLCSACCLFFSARTIIPLNLFWIFAVTLFTWRIAWRSLNSLRVHFPRKPIWPLGVLLNVECWCFSLSMEFLTMFPSTCYLIPCMVSKLWVTLFQISSGKSDLACDVIILLSCTFPLAMSNHALSFDVISRICLEEYLLASQLQVHSNNGFCFPTSHFFV